MFLLPEHLFIYKSPYHETNLMKHSGCKLFFCGRHYQLKPLKPFIENMVTSHSLLTNEWRIKVLNFPTKCPHCWLKHSARGRKIKMGEKKQKYGALGVLKSKVCIQRGLPHSFEECGTAPGSWGRHRAP